MEPIHKVTSLDYSLIHKLKMHQKIYKGGNLLTNNNNQDNFNELNTRDMDKKPRVDDSFEEEFSAPLTPARNDFIIDEEPENEVYFQGTSIIGWASLILSVLALFMMPIILGGAGIIFGFVARSRDAEWLGNIAIVVGIIAILGALLIRPLL